MLHNLSFVSYRNTYMLSANLVWDSFWLRITFERKEENAAIPEKNVNRRPTL